jgi:hypothetical protein
LKCEVVPKDPPNAKSVDPKEAYKKTTVRICGDGPDKITQLEIDLQKAPNNMEPAAEPRNIRIDDRARVQFLLRNLSPLDVCSRNPSAPTPTAETNVAESLATTLAGLGGLAIGSNTSKLAANNQMSAADSVRVGILQAKAPECDIAEDPEY